VEVGLEDIPQGEPQGDPLEITEQKPAGRPRWLSIVYEVIQTLLMAAVLYFLINSVIARVRVQNISMEPTLLPNELLMVNKLAYKLGDMHTGDVIIFHYPLNPQEDYIKRLIGLPGDTVTVRGGVVSVNGYELEEPYISATPNYEGEWQVPEGHVFVLGDNRNSSNDSHHWGFVPVENILGKALAIYWPPDKIKSLAPPPQVQAATP
jgi:signal peptidase I